MVGVVDREIRCRKEVEVVLKDGDFLDI